MKVGNKTLTNNGSSDGMILKIAIQMGVPEVQELQVENKRKEFKITTDVNEIDGVCCDVMCLYSLCNRVIVNEVDGVYVLCCDVFVLPV